MAPDDVQLGDINREMSQCTSVSHARAILSSLHMTVRICTHRVSPKAATSNAEHAATPGTAIIAAARTSCSRASDALSCNMMDGVPITGDEPNRTVMIEAVGRTATGDEI